MANDAKVGMTLIRPVNKGQGHSFWHRCSRTHRLATIHNITDDNDGGRQTQHCSISATVSRPYGRLKTECANLQQLIFLFVPVSRG